LNKAPPANQQTGTKVKALFLGDQQGMGRTGAERTPVFAATDAQRARIDAEIAP
jgi:hypothetical protein